MNVHKHLGHLAEQIRAGNVEQTESGILIGREVMAKGVYRFRKNDEDWEYANNIVPTAALNHLLDVGLRNQTRYATWYLALFSGTTAPAASWTATNFATVASELTSGTEGYSESTRQVWTPSAASGGVIDDYGSQAVFTMVSATTVTVRGMALLSDSAKGSTSGVLMSAVNLSTGAKSFATGETFTCGYRLTLSM